MFGIDDIEDAARLIYRQMQATPQYVWPLLGERTGSTVWVKHENHTPTGAFKVRGGITFMDWLKRTHPGTPGIVTATRGNHGQSQARAATAAGLKAKILVPFGNSVEKNAAMRAFGADLIEFGSDFDEARIEAMRLAEVEGLFCVPPFHRELLRGVATYALELFGAARDLDTVYVPIGCGSGICGVIAVRDALGLATEVVGVVSTEAAGAKLSFEAGKLIETNSANTIADGMAVRVPVQEAFDIYAEGASRIVAVSDDEIAAAMRILYSDTHNLAEGAGAAALAALIQEKHRMRGKKVGIILSGGNVDLPLYAKVLAGDAPKAG
ncbi:threonine dehydratase [Pseudolabrys sp. Root1462]|uniref:threonine dehydratase n=1 Tax=Pseudolabrys sp. Root1462 TaxID=1736466 RepID=UPI00191049E7|nr:threonine dehydratase [Pseudolabrys sp. Root1462]